MSFKITINNEEVVSNSNLQIKEEMLSTSSTILKNCYPKLWEQDKDYVSRYYFPKDYSKCKILNETYHPEDPGITVKGTNLNINYDNSKNWELKGLFGDTLQNGTPTPSSPVPIQSVTGLQNIEICGKNLFDKNKCELVGGVSFNNTENHAYTITSGTSRNFVIIQVQPSTIYTISVNGSRAYLGELKTKTTEAGNGSNSWIYNEKTFTTTSRTNYIGLLIDMTDLTNFTMQVEQGSATEYEPYKGNTYEVNLGKNLLPNLVTTQTLNGMTITKNEDGSLTFNGTANAGTNLNINYASGSYIHLENGKKYTASLTNNNGIYFRLAKVSGGNVATFDTPNKQVTFTSNYTGDCFVYLTILNGTTFDNLTIYPQIELGNATSYSPYFTPIELNKINTYQDSIKKSSGKNLFDIKTIVKGRLDNGVVGYESDTSELTLNDNSYSFTTTKNYRGIVSDFIEVKGNTTYILSSKNDISVNFNFFDTNKTFISTANGNGGTSVGRVVTTPENAKYVRLYNWLNSAGSTTVEIPQFEENSQMTSYEPYLPKGTWYLENQVGKVVLDGSENWANTYGTNLFNIPSFLNSKPFIVGYGLSNYYKYNPVQSGINNNTVNGDFVLQKSSVPDYNIFIKNTNISTPADFKNWLSTHNTEIIYPLATPTYIEITNEELISQLEAIYQSQLYNGINNISVNSENLSSSLEIHYNFNEEYTTEDLIFCGCIKNTGRISLNPREPHYCDLQILDFKTLLSEGDTLNYVISNKTITEAINQVVASISDYGFVVGNILLNNPNELIGAYSTLNKTAYDVFQYFADITQSRWTTRMVDENTIAIDFYDPTLMPVGTEIKSTTQFYEDNNIVDISFNYSTNDYRNKQIMTSDEVFANITQAETIIADGYTKSFMCENKIGLITSITLNGTPQTFITKNEEQLGYSGDFIYQPGENIFNSSNTISAGSSIVITYYAIVKGREIILNTTESNRIETQIGRKGIISRYENRNDSTSSQELQKIGQSYIKYKGQAEISLKVITTKDIWNVGEIVDYDAPLQDLTTDYMVKSKQIDMYLNAGEIFYTYELTSNFNYENAVNYFDNQRAKNQGNIGEGETITRNIDLESTALIQFYDTEIEEVQVQNPSSIEFALDGVLI